MRFLFLLISAHLIAATIGIGLDHPISVETQKWLKMSLDDIDQHNNTNNQCSEIDELPTAKELTKQIKEMRNKLGNSSKTITTGDVETLLNAFIAYWKAALVKMKEEFPKIKKAFVDAKKIMDKKGGLTRILPQVKSDELCKIVDTFSDYRKISADIMQNFLEKENDCEEKLTNQIAEMSNKLRSYDYEVTPEDVNTLFNAFREYWELTANRTEKILKRKKNELSNSGKKSITLGDVATSSRGMEKEITEAKKAYDEAAKQMKNEIKPTNSSQIRQVLKIFSAYRGVSVNMMETFPKTENDQNELKKQIDEMRKKLEDDTYKAPSNDVKTWIKLFCDYWDATADRMEKFIKTTEDYKTEGHLKKAIETKHISKSNNAIYKKIEEDVNESVLQSFREAYQTVHLQSLQNELLEIPKSFEFTKQTAKFYRKNPLWLFAYAGVISDIAIALPTDAVNGFRVGTNKAKQKKVQKKLEGVKKTSTTFSPQR